MTEPELPEYEIKLNAFEIGLIVGSIYNNMKQYPSNRQAFEKIMGKFNEIAKNFYEDNK